MAKRRPVKQKRVKLAYNFFRLHFKEGTQELMKGEFPEWAQEFLALRGYDSKMRPRDFQAVYLMALVRELDAIPLEDRPHCLEIRDPVNRLVRRYSRVFDWNYPHPDGYGNKRVR